MSKKIVHMADKVDREIGTARCGMSLKRCESSDEIGRVTCERCGAEPPQDSQSIEFERLKNISNKSLELCDKYRSALDRRVIECERLKRVVKDLSSLI